MHRYIQTDSQTDRHTDIETYKGREEEYTSTARFRASEFSEPSSGMFNR